ncbi:hypothetical protein [Cohnella faecalis]|uniref:Uncharacterized protein n=1 Tax=Cohnella faecalis TaxID=2315694 RepID=A0A398CJW8_9BACL|nr:hypothetical protein [Cohnella faecalis]RIE03606.1 hypothetical protein D3H35_10730 [Cohnella faecalis]
MGLVSQLFLSSNRLHAYRSQKTERQLQRTDRGQEIHLSARPLERPVQIAAEPGIDLSRFVLSVDLIDPWFELRKIQVISRADYQEDDIASIHVTLEYGIR